jgi:hypothetical protein
LDPPNCDDPVQLNEVGPPAVPFGLPEFDEEPMWWWRWCLRAASTGVNVSESIASVTKVSAMSFISLPPREFGVNRSKRK